MDAGSQKPGDPLVSFLQDEDVIGVSRLGIHPAFEGPTFCTLLFAREETRVRVLDSRYVPAFQAAMTKPTGALGPFGPLRSWSELRNAAFAAPSCDTMTEDGVIYSHAVLDWSGAFEARWSNPNWGRHRQQCELAKAYESLLEAWGLGLEPGTRVRILTGLMAGYVGRVDRIESPDVRLRVLAELGGKEVALNLAISDIEFAPDG